MFERIIKPLILSMITVALTIGLIFGAGYFLDPSNSQECLDTIEAFHSIPENSVDALFLGSSRGWKGTDTGYLSEKYGINAWNYGANWQYSNTILLFLKDALLTQKPKSVFIESSILSYYLRDVNMVGQIYYTRKLKDSPGRRQFLNECFGDHVDRYISYYIPLAMFHENWTEIGKDNFLVPDPARFVKSNGFYASDYVYDEIGPDYSTFTEKEFEEPSLLALEEIVQICEANGIELVFYTLPWHEEYSYDAALSRFCEEHGLAFYNFYKNMDLIDFDWTTDMQDPGHLNTHGARKVADYFGKNYFS